LAYGTEEELALVTEAKNGSDYALARLLQEHYNAVYRFLCKLTLDPQFAADITQDCMERIIEKLALFDPDQSAFETWAITIAKNLWIEECRRNNRRVKLAQRYAAETEAPNSASSRDETLAIEQKDELLAAINALDARQRTPILMRHAGGFRYEEIARALKIPIGTVKSRISNGIKTLRKELERYDGQKN
jgi:RNA polymerase sigma-70 factor, ECF subfamily